MKEINLKEIIEGYLKKHISNYPVFLQKMLLKFLNWFLCTKDIQSYFIKTKDKTNFNFIEKFFKNLDFKCTCNAYRLNKIPKKGPLIIIANHPLGGLDGLAILLEISKVRPDVQAIVNEILLNISNLKDVFLPFNVYTAKAQRKALMGIKECMEKQRALLIFPAGSVSRLGKKGIHDEKWKKGAVQFAKKFNAPILPIYVNARNSFSFYITALFSSTLSMLMLPRELVKKSHKSINLKIGDLILPNELNIDDIQNQTDFLQKKLYDIGKNKNYE